MPGPSQPPAVTVPPRSQKFDPLSVRKLKVMMIHIPYPLSVRELKYTYYYTGNNILTIHLDAHAFWSVNHNIKTPIEIAIILNLYCSSCSS